jgi:hypothetical protein
MQMQSCTKRNQGIARNKFVLRRYTLHMQDLPITPHFYVHVHPRSSIGLLFCFYTILYRLFIPPPILQKLPKRPRTNIISPSFIDTVLDQRAECKIVGRSYFRGLEQFRKVLKSLDTTRAEEEWDSSMAVVYTGSRESVHLVGSVTPRKRGSELHGGNSLSIWRRFLCFVFGLAFGREGANWALTDRPKCGFVGFVIIFRVQQLVRGFCGCVFHCKFAAAIRFIFKWDWVRRPCAIFVFESKHCSITWARYSGPKFATHSGAVLW